MGPSPTAEVLTQLPDAIASQTAAPTAGEATPTEAPPTSTELPPESTEESTKAPPPATATVESPTQLTLVPKDKPTEGPSPTPTPQGEAFDPTKTYGNPTLMDPMNSTSYGNWKVNNRLPNTDYLQISFENDSLYVTGKRPGFSTWFFSWPTLTDFYMQMEVKTETCSSKDEYGLIVRGPGHQAGVSYGYIVAFNCDREFRITRLDSADPFATTDLVSLSKSDQINAGADEKNVIGIRAIGNTLSVFANGYQIAEVKDATFPKGRYGLFVQAGFESYYGYTYRPVQLVYWDLSK